MSERRILTHTKRALDEYGEAQAARDALYEVAHETPAKYKKWVKAEDDAREALAQAYHKDTGYSVDRCRLISIDQFKRWCTK